MYHSILVPLDGSTPSEQSLAYAAGLARRSGASLELVYVHTPLLLGEGSMYLATPDAELWEEEKKYLQNVVELLKKTGLEKVSAHLREGPIAETLQEEALGKGCDLVVMTTHGRGPVSRFWLGSVADQLVHRLPIPLLLIRTPENEALPATEPEIRNILVALDGTPTAEQILQPVGALARVQGASLTLLRVVPVQVPHTGHETPAPDVLLPDTRRAEAQVYLQRMTDSLRNQGYAVQTRILVDAHPASAILHEAACGDYDLLAVETHARRGLPRLFLGSIADKIVRGATIPVLIHRCLPS